MPNSEWSAAVTRLKALRGTVVPLVTPVDEQRRVCARSMTRLMASLRGKVTGYLPALSTGEGWLLDDQQWQDVLRLTVEHADGAPVLVGVEVGDVPAVLARATVARELGADAIVVPPPFPTEGKRATLAEHIAAVLAESPLPVFVYHENAVSKMPLEVDALREACALDGVVGVKESSGDAAFTRAVLDSDLPVPLFQGWEHLIAAAPGVHGFVGPLANLEPEACNDALATFSRSAQDRVDELTSLYRLQAEDWYLHVKAELAGRGVIDTALAVK